MRYTFPTDYNTKGCFVVLIDKALLPIVAGKVRELYNHWQWNSPADYELGYNAIAELEACMTRLCVEQLVASNDRLYRLLDTNLSGQQYNTLNQNGDVIITPNIPIVPEPVTRSLHSRLERLEYLMDNFFNGGTYSPDFLNTTSVRDQLTAIIEALQASNSANTDDWAELLSNLGELLVLMG